MTAASLGPTTRGRRWISLLFCSQGLFDQIFTQCAPRERGERKDLGLPRRHQRAGPWKDGASGSRTSSRTASSSPDTADWNSAIGGFLVSVCAVHTEVPGDGHPTAAGHAV